MNFRLRWGMVGGGHDSMIGNIHRMAARLDNHYELVCGCFSRDRNKSMQLKDELYLPEGRIYSSYEEMFRVESHLPKDQRMQVVSVVTPTDSHYEIVKSALMHHFDVIVDKPLVNTIEEAKNLESICKSSGRSVCVTFTYAGYPLVKEIRELVAQKKLGEIVKIEIYFLQGWLCQSFDKLPWRLDPNRVIAGTLSDIGSHALYLLKYILNKPIDIIKSNLNSFGKQSLLDDDVQLLLRMDKTIGLINLSQIANGASDVMINIYGTQRSLRWQQKNANILTMLEEGKPDLVFHAGRNNQYLADITRRNCRTPSGHPEGYIEAFANHYRNFALYLKNHQSMDYPTLSEGTEITKIINGITH